MKQAVLVAVLKRHLCGSSFYAHQASSPHCPSQRYGLRWRWFRTWPILRSRRIVVLWPQRSPCTGTQHLHPVLLSSCIICIEPKLTSPSTLTAPFLLQTPPLLKQRSPYLPVDEPFFLGRRLAGNLGRIESDPGISQTEG